MLMISFGASNNKQTNTGTHTCTSSPRIVINIVTKQWPHQYHHHQLLIIKVIIIRLQPPPSFSLPLFSPFSLSPSLTYSLLGYNNTSFCFSPSLFSSLSPPHSLTHCGVIMTHSFCLVDHNRNLIPNIYFVHCLWPKKKTINLSAPTQTHTCVSHNLFYQYSCMCVHAREPTQTHMVTIVRAHHHFKLRRTT